MIHNICKLDKCTACGACLNACPRKCISYRHDKLGHLYPVIDGRKCIECHACERVCQVNHPLELHKPLTAFAGMHKNQDDYKTSTSGGAATAFAQKIISENGVVYGAAWTEGLGVEHIRVDSLNDIYKLQGSKYVQSRITSTLFESVRKDLKAHVKVLFIGTPCQVGGLKSYLRKEYDNLFLVDIVCHGVPSVRLFQKHIRNVAGSLDKDIHISFRDSDGYSLVVTKKQMVIYKKRLWIERYEDAYFNSFIDGYTFRDSCYTCRYATQKRVSDVTIGDFWGIGTDFVISHDFGCSCVLPITEKGMWLVRNSPLNVYERSVKEAVDGNSQLRHHYERNRRINFFRLLNSFFGFNLAYIMTNMDHLLFVMRCKLQLGTRIKKKLGI